MGFKRFIQMMYYLQIAFFISGIYLLFVYIITNNARHIPIMTGVLFINILAIKTIRDRFK